MMAKLYRRTLFCLALLAAALTAGSTAALAQDRAPANAPITPEIQAMKAKIALATRMLVREGLLASSGHVSMRVPGTNLVLIGPENVTRDLLTADDVMTVDLDGKQVGGTRKIPSETEIHVGIYRARPDVMSIIHAHTKYSVAFSITGKPILPVHMHGAIFADGVPVYPHVGHVGTRAQGDELAKILGPHRAVLLKMHGTAVVGHTLEEAFVAALQLEENAEEQILAQQTGGVVKPMSAEDVKASIAESWRPDSIAKRWQYYVDKYGDIMKSAPAR